VKPLKRVIIVIIVRITFILIRFSAKAELVSVLPKKKVEKQRI
jgi:hypothetical protein